MSARNGAPANVNLRLPRDPGFRSRGDCNSTPAVLMSSTRTLMFAGRFANSSATWWRGTFRRSSIPLLCRLPNPEYPEYCKALALKCKWVAKLRQTFVYLNNAMFFNDLWVCPWRLLRGDGSSESLG